MIDRILVVAPHLGALTDCARTLDDLTARRCRVHVAVSTDPPPGTDLTAFTGKFHRLTVGLAPPLDKWVALGTTVRARLERDRWLTSIERSVPSSPAILDFLRAHHPDVLIVVPLFDIRSAAQSYVQAAGELGIATLGFPSRWDDVARGGVLHRLPDCVALWNREQRRQLVETRGVPARRTIVLGASLALDAASVVSGFSRTSAPDPVVSGFSRTSREELGLSPERAVILCAPGHSSDRDRLTQWIESIRSSLDPFVRDSQLVVHIEPPAGVQQAARAPAEDVLVVPRAESDPMQYSADVVRALVCADVVVSWDTTLLFEAAARGKPVVALLWPDSGDPELARFCADEGTRRGWPIAASTLAEHVSAIATLLAKPLAIEQRAAARALVRPHGDLLPGFLLSARALQEVIARRAETPPAAPASIWSRLLLSPLANLALRRARTMTVPRERSRVSRVLVAVASAKSLFLHQSLLRVLAERGHQLTIVFTARAQFPVELYDKVKCDVPGVTVAGVLSERRDAWAAVSSALLGMFSLGTIAHRKRRDAWRRVPSWLARYADLSMTGRVRRLGSLMLRMRLMARILSRLARRLTRWVPPSEAARSFIAGNDLDVLAVIPDDDAVAAFESAGTQLDLIAAAESLGIPVVAGAGASELHVHPLAMSRARVMCVWNDEQQRAATRLGTPASRLVVTGAPPLDRCLHDAPIVDGREFREMLGLPSDRPFVLFAASSGLMSEPGEEVDLIRTWVKALRESADSVLRQLTVLVRPSPLGISRWRKADFDDASIVMGPRTFERSGELDAVLLSESVRFAALTISADPLTLLMAAGLGRPAAVVLPPRFAMQADAIPLDYLWKTEGSRVRYMASLTDLSEYVQDVLRVQEAFSPEPFVRAQLQPRPDVSPAVAAADCIERAAAKSRRRQAGVSRSTIESRD